MRLVGLASPRRPGAQAMITWCVLGCLALFWLPLSILL
jgi:hypothetical protein